jgi:hypothetical protein
MFECVEYKNLEDFFDLLSCQIYPKVAELVKRENQSLLKVCNSILKKVGIEINQAFRGRSNNKGSDFLG